MTDPAFPPNGSTRVLLAATLRWTFGARLAVAFRDLGCGVDRWCPRGHPLDTVRGLDRGHRASRPWPRSLRAVLAAGAHDLVIPCDDEAAGLLQAIHRESRDDRLCDVLERSLGRLAPEPCGSARGELLNLARSLGVRTPPAADVASLAALGRWSAEHGFPVVLKSDRSWGGRGVAVLRSAAELAPAYQRARRAPWRDVLSDYLVRRDAAPLLERLFGVAPPLTVQGFARGRPANRAVACWRGEVLGGISVEALQTQSATGPASVVRLIEHEAMDEAARRIVGALGLSGFCGLDFMLDGATGEAQLLELNPRATPVCHFDRAGAPSLPALLLGRLGAAPARETRGVTHAGVVAIFPGEWQRDPRSRWLTEAFHDVPWAEPALVRDAMRGPWDERGLVARLRARLRPPAATPAAPVERVAPAAPSC